MPISKREFLKISGLTAGIAGLSAAGLTACSSSPDPDDNDGGGKGLESITGDVQPIGVDERLSRIAKAQMLMVDAGIDAIVLEPGSAMLYFSGVSWRRSERLTAVIIPRRGEIAVITPYFEEPSVRESMIFGDDIRTWHEH